MRFFGRAILCKSLMRVIFGEGLWSSSIRKNYLEDKDLVFWYCRGSIRISHGFVILLSLRKVQHYFLQCLSETFSLATMSSSALILLLVIVGTHASLNICYLFFTKMVYSCGIKLFHLGAALSLFGKALMNFTCLSRYIQIGIQC